MNRIFVALLISIIGILGVSATAQAAAQKTGQSPSEVRKYWTAERMRNATPVDHSQRAGAPSAKAGKGSGKGSGGGGGSTLGRSTEVVVSPGTPQTAHGKVFFSDNGWNYVCSGTALVGDVVWTAGHCVNEGPGAYYSNFIFVPAYRDGVAPYGQFAATQLMTSNSWALAGEFGVDAGAAVVSTNANGDTLSEAVVERTITFNSPRNQTYSAYGYPAAKKFNGQRLRVCETAWSRDDASTSPATMGIPCDMTGGSSGGGWVTSTGLVASVVSYGYSSLKNVLFGPHLEAEAQQLYGDAVAAAG